MKRAYHDILLADGTLLAGPVVVETNRDGSIVSWHLLDGEEPFTEWVGGTYTVEQKPRPLEKVKNNSCNSF